MLTYIFISSLCMFVFQFERFKSIFNLKVIKFWNISHYPNMYFKFVIMSPGHVFCVKPHIQCANGSIILWKMLSIFLRSCYLQLVKQIFTLSNVENVKVTLFVSLKWTKVTLNISVLQTQHKTSTINWIQVKLLYIVITYQVPLPRWLFIKMSNFSWTYILVLIYKFSKHLASYQVNWIQPSLTGPRVFMKVKMTRSLDFPNLLKSVIIVSIWRWSFRVVFGVKLRCRPSKSNIKLDRCNWWQLSHRLFFLAV